MVIVWSHRAQRELDEAVEFIKGQSPFGARRVASRIAKRVADLTQFPEQGVPSRRGMRRLDITRTPYVVIYRTRGDEITIVAVLHGRRKRRT